MLFLKLLKFLAVVVVAGVVGAALGAALAKLTSQDDHPPIAPDTMSATTTATSTAADTTATSTQSRTDSPTTRVQILSAVLYPARTARGRARQRARVVVGVRLTSPSTDTLPAQAPVLIVGASRVRADPRAADAAGTLLRPLAPRETATGELRFETTGSVTQRLAMHRRARLSIAQRTVNVKIRISSTQAPAG